MGERRYSSTTLHLGTTWRWVLSFTPLPLYSRGKSPQHKLDRRLGGPQSLPGHYEIEKNFLPLPGIKSRPSSPKPVNIPTELSRLPFKSIQIFVWTQWKKSRGRYDIDGKEMSRRISVKDWTWILQKCSDNRSCSANTARLMEEGAVACFKVLQRHSPGRSKGNQ
jgi:hypothetical protein